MRDVDKRRHRKKMMKKSCGNKVKYPDITSSAAAATAISHKRGEKFRSYKCRFGNHYHIGHVDKKSY